MTMGLSLRNYLATALACPCCQQMVDPARQEATAVEVALVGAEPYAVCPTCRQEVAGPWSPAYRRRVRRVRKEWK